MPVQLVNLRVLGDEERVVAGRLVPEYYGKLARQVKDPLVVVQFKRYKAAGRRAKFSIHARVDAPSVLVSAEAFDWDFARALHKVMRKVHSELEHKLKLDGQGKPFGKESRMRRRRLRAVKT